MKLRLKSFLINAITLILLLLAMYFLASKLSLRGFAKLEDAFMSQNADRAVSVILDRVDEIDTQTDDWASWDDTYRFIQDKNQAYIDANLLDPSFFTLKIDFMAFFDRSGSAVFVKSADPENSSVVKNNSLPEDMIEKLRRLPETSKGIVFHGERPLLAAARPILRSDKQGVSLGKLVFGRYLDTMQLKKLFRVIGYPFSVARVSGGGAAAAAGGTNAPVSVSGTRERITARGAIRAIDGKDRLFVTVDFPRSILAQGRRSVMYLGLALLCAGCIFLLVLYLLTEKLILSRLLKLSGSIVGMAAVRDLKGDVRLPGNDEISELSKEIDGLVRSLSFSEQELMESEKKYKAIFENTGNAMILVNGKTGRISLANSEFERLSGYSNAEVAGLTLAELTSGLSDTVHGGAAPSSVQFGCEFRVARKDGSLTPVMASIARGPGETFVWSLLDITGRKHMEDTLKESKQRMTDIINFLPDATFAVNVEGTVIVWNRAIEEMTGVKSEQMIGKGDYEYAIPFYGHRRPMLIDMILRQAIPGMEKRYSRMTRENDVMTAETSNSRGDTLVCYGCRATRLYNTHGELTGAIESVRDITGRKKTDTLLYLQTRELEIRAAELEDSRVALINMMEDVTEEVAARTRKEELLEASLQEKEMLLKEVHHRVKNNLQVIYSLLNLQSKHIVNENDLQLFAECRDRIKSMIFVHEKLYASRDLSAIDFSEYLQTLAKSLFNSYRLTAERVTLSITSPEAVFFGIDKAIPCGLIINELVSNSLKYGFPGCSPGTISIDFRRDDSGSYILKVNDDGVGMPDGFDFRNSASLGLQLVMTLVEQINGSIRKEEGKGVSFIVQFDIAPADTPDELIDKRRSDV